MKPALSDLRRPATTDVALVRVLIVLTLLSTIVQIGRDPAQLVFQLGLLAPLAWRRRAPYAVFWLVISVSFAHWAYQHTLVPGDVGVLVVLYTVAEFCTPRRAWIAGAAVAVRAMMEALHRTPAQGVAEFVGLCASATAAAMIGAYVRSRRDYLAALEDRAARMERARIAREMHDIVTHSLSVMVTLADGAALINERNPDKATSAMKQVSEAGRQALTDMRRFLDVLKADEPEALRHPQPGIAQLEGLAAQMRAAGLPVRLRIAGETATVPVGAQLTVYRLVQEALTNTLKHAAPGASATVGVSRAGDLLEVVVRDDGRPLSRNPVAGHGIDGMRYRVGAFGGHVEAGPDGGGWRVAARFAVGGDGRDRDRPAPVGAEGSPWRAMDGLGQDRDRPVPVTAEGPPRPPADGLRQAAS